MSAGFFQTISDYLPTQGTALAGQVDNLFNFILYLSLISFVVLIGGMTFFIIKYKRKTPNDKTPYITGNHLLEFIWSFIPLVLMLAIFVWGWVVFKAAHTYPENAVEIKVYGQKWLWTFEHSNGKKEDGDLYAPAGRPVVLTMTSSDVIHSFYIPEFRIKQDVVPGKRSKMWFNAPNPGDYQVFCAEFCGTGHSKMMAKVHIVPQGVYDAYLAVNDSANMPPLELGKAIYVKKACNVCHSDDGSKKIGPSFKGLWGKTDGSKVLVDDAYVTESILQPQAKIVAGYPRPSPMPPFQGQLTEQEVNGVIEYLKSLK
jgi:cytochrome c oxidase subunit 2